MNYGLQLYSLRDITDKDMDAALREVSKMGYEFVEFAGFMGHSPKAIAEMLDKYSLKASGTHSGVDGLQPDVIKDSIRAHKEIGCENYIIPGADIRTGAKLKALIDLINYAQPILEEEGIKLHFHNHKGEFLPNSDGRYAHYELEKKTKILFEIDTYWAFAAGRDPVALMERLKNRISVIHVKDGSGAEARALGEGDAPVCAVVNKARELGFTMVVESEGLNPTGLEEVKRCIDFLRTV